MTKTRLHLDYETYSERDIRGTGHIAYANHWSTEVLMCAYAFGDDEVKHWDAMRDPIPKDLADALVDPNVVKWAHNASFEIAITCLVLNRDYNLAIPNPIDDPQAFREYLKQWRCTMVLGMSMSMAGSLAKQGEALKSSKTKQAEEGSSLIYKFCKPRTRLSKKDQSPRWTEANAPNEWAAFCKYNVVDVEAERDNWKKMQRFAMPEHEWRLWELDQFINFTGLPVDIELVDAAIEMARQVKAVNTDKLREITGLFNPTSRDAFFEWAKTMGYAGSDVTKETVLRQISKLIGSDDEHDRVLLRALELRLLVTKNAVKKFNSLKKATQDGRLRGCFQFAGAGRTWRWAGRIFQPQNISRGVIEPIELEDGTLDVSNFETAIATVTDGCIDEADLLYGVEEMPDILSSLVRPAIRAEGGKTLTVCDLSSIEAVMGAWCANSEYMLDLFRNGLDPYKDYASKLYSIPYSEITKAMRKFCKPPVLGCIYRLGGFGLKKYAASMGVTMDEDEAYKAVDIYRKAYPDIPIVWEDLERAAKKCIVTKGSVTVNGKFTFEYRHPCMVIKLPSGRELVYIQPRVESKKIHFKDRKTGKGKSFTRPCITYMGVNQYTRKWERITTHGGKILENVTQAVARDVLAHGLMQIDKHTGPEVSIVGHVHDEILTETPDQPIYLDLIRGLMTDTPDWCADAPIGASGFQNQFYLKD